MRVINTKSFYLTDTGRVREHNEDSVTILKNMNSEYLLVVADGMGGHRKGEVASALTVTHLGKRFTESASIGTKIDAVNWLSDNINEINREILDYGEKNENSKGLGTTVVAAIVTKEFLIFANIGDSSGYVMKNNKLHRVTKPHTLVNLLVDAGDLTEEQAKTHPKKNMLTKALGCTPYVEPDIRARNFEKDDIFIMCSDGLTNMVEEKRIYELVKQDINTATNNLVNEANSAGGYDNITVIIIN